MNSRQVNLLVRAALTLLLLVGLLTSAHEQASATTVQCFVKASATGANTGVSWTDAFTDLQSALGGSSCTEVWVASGTYKPTVATNLADLRTRTFALKNGVAIYGGFAGTETLRSQRNPSTNSTFLSGEIGIQGDPTDNSYHVVLGSGLNSTAILDGFIITAGKADSGNYGGGMLNNSGSPTLANLTFAGNSSSFYGGGLYNYNGSPSLTNVLFTTNSATFDGAGMYTDGDSNPALSQVTFDANLAGVNGGGMLVASGSPTLSNVTFHSNTAANGAGMSNHNSSTAHLDHVTFSSNSASSQGGGMRNEESSPVLSNVTFSGNGSYDGGAIYNYNSSPSISHTTFSGNSATHEGGGIRNDQGAPIFTDVTFSSNSATSAGGGMFNFTSAPSLTNVTFSGNFTGGFGGAMRNDSSDPSLAKVTFSGNSAASGGGMSNTGSTPTLQNVTFHVNSAISTDGGAMYNGNGSSPHLKNVTFNGNTAFGNGGGIANDGSSNPVIVNSILYGDGNGELFNTNSSAPVVSYTDVQGGYAGTGNIDADPLLGTLANSGGLTETMALGWGSPAIDAGNNPNCAATDQRGITRPADGNGDGVARCDMGATESRYLKTAFKSGGKADGWVLESGESSNVGGSHDAASGSFNLGDDPANRQYRGILSFNTASLPDTSTLIAVTLQIRQAALVGSNPFNTLGKIQVDLRTGAFGNNSALQSSDFQALPTKSTVMTIGNTPDASGWYKKKLASADFADVNLVGTTQLRLRFARARPSRRR